MPGPAVDPAELRRLVRASVLELRTLAEHRRRLAATARAGWRGPRRAAFDDALAGIEAETARLCDLLEALGRRAEPAPGGPR